MVVRTSEPTEVPLQCATKIPSITNTSLQPGPLNLSSTIERSSFRQDNLPIAKEQRYDTKLFIESQRSGSNVPVIDRRRLGAAYTTREKRTTSAAVRILNIKESATEDDFKVYFAVRNLHLSDDHRSLVFTRAEDGQKSTTISFDSLETWRRALNLNRTERKLGGAVIDFDFKFMGFTTFSEGTELDVIALHGMNGHAFSSFEYREEDYSFMWLRDALPQRIPNARIMVYGYDADVVSNVCTGRVRTYAETFMQRLGVIRKDSKRPLILIGHAFGGLIIKQALLLNSADGSFDAIVNSVRGVMFMATPHQGVKGFDYLLFLEKVFGVAGETFRYDLVAEQDAKKIVLFDLSVDFKELIARKNILVRTLYETRKTKVDESCWVGIVDEQSAKLGVAGERALGINADHINICKFGPGDISLHEVMSVTEELCRTSFI